MHIAFKNVKKFFTQYDCNTNPRTTITILEDYLSQLDIQVEAKN
jgi:hypothetical protein